MASTMERSQRNLQRAAQVAAAHSTAKVQDQTLQVVKQPCTDAKGESGSYTGGILVHHHGLPHGTGEMHYEAQDTTPSTVESYQGDWIFGEWHGQGLCRLQNGDVYSGQFVAHERHGKGEYTWASTTSTGKYVKQRSYRGDFWHNQRQGHGIYTWRTLDPGTGELVTKPSTYSGSFVNGQREGQGVFESPSLKYTGEWYQGHYHGYGVLQDLVQGTLYRGYLEGSKKHGRGSLVQERPPKGQSPADNFEPHLIHEGLWLENEPFIETALAPQSEVTDDATVGDSSSVASYTVLATPQLVEDAHGNQGFYKGLVQRRLPQGVGTIQYLEGSSLVEYEGFWQSGSKHGFGRASYSTGDTYQGNWVQNQAQGPGEYTHYPDWVASPNSGVGDGPASVPPRNPAEARVYKGVFHQSLLHNGSNVDGSERTLCQVLYPNGDIYEGDYWEGHRQGQGTLTFHDGSRYEGAWELGLYHGQGRLSTPRAIYTGTFARGIFHGEGKLQTVDNGKEQHILYEGKWTKGFPEVDPSDTLNFSFGHLQIPHPPLDDPFGELPKDMEWAAPQEVDESLRRRDDPVTMPVLLDILDQLARPPDDASASLPQLVRRLSPLPNKRIPRVPKGTLPPRQRLAKKKASASSSNEANATAPAPAAPSASISTSLTSSILSSFMGSSDSKNSASMIAPSEPVCKAVVDVAVWDGQENPGRYTGLLHLESQRPHGVGRMVYQDGNRIHEGFWEYGHRQGHGRCLFVKIGDYHEGNYHQNLREGPGKYFWKDGRQFVGNYHLDERSGAGKFVYPNGDAYEGNFEKGQRHGQGTFVFGNKKKRAGPQQQLVESAIQATRYQGAWKNGVYDGVGRLEWKTMVRGMGSCQLNAYEGLFVAGVFEGAGVETMDGTVVRQGIWEAGRFIQSTMPCEEEVESANSSPEEKAMVESFEKVALDEVEDNTSALKKIPSMDLEDDLLEEENPEEKPRVRPTPKSGSKAGPSRHVSSAECASSTAEESNYELQRLQWRQSLEPS